MPVGELQGVLLTEIPEGFTGGEGLGLQVTITVGGFGLILGDPVCFAIHQCLDLGVGRNFGGAYHQFAVGVDFQADGAAVAADDLVNFHCCLRDLSL